MFSSSLSSSPDGCFKIFCVLSTSPSATMFFFFNKQTASAEETETHSKSTTVMRAAAKIAAAHLKRTAASESQNQQTFGCFAGQLLFIYLFSLQTNNNVPRQKEAELCDGRDDYTPLTVLLWMPQRQIPRLHMGQQRLCLPATVAAAAALPGWIRWDWR